MEGFTKVDIDDYLEYILERCLQPGKAVNQAEDGDTPLVKAVYQKITAALRQEHKAEVGEIRFSLEE